MPGIAVIVSGSVREALFAQPLVAALPDATVFAPAESLDVFRLQTVGHGFAVHSGAGLVEAWGRLRRLPASVLVVPPPVTAASAALAYLSGIQKRVAVDRGAAWWATDAVAVPAGLHPVEVATRLAAHVLHRDPGVAPPQLQVADGTRARLDARLQSAGVGPHHRVLVAIPGGGNWVRRGPRPLWPAERFAVVANQLRPDLLVALRGATDDRPVREMLAGVPLATAVVDLGAVRPADVAALAGRSVGVIGHDGDALHAAAAGGGRTLGLLRPGEVSPYGPAASAVRVDSLAGLKALDVIEAARRHLGVSAHV